MIKLKIEHVKLKQFILTWYDTWLPLKKFMYFQTRFIPGSIFAHNQPVVTLSPWEAITFELSAGHTKQLVEHKKKKD